MAAMVSLIADGASDGVVEGMATGMAEGTVVESVMCMAWWWTFYQALGSEQSMHYSMS